MAGWSVSWTAGDFFERVNPGWSLQSSSFIHKSHEGSRVDTGSAVAPLSRRTDRFIWAAGCFPSGLKLTHTHPYSITRQSATDPLLFILSSSSSSLDPQVTLKTIFSPPPSPHHSLCSLHSPCSPLKLGHCSIQLQLLPRVTSTYRLATTQSPLTPSSSILVASVSPSLGVCSVQGWLWNLMPLFFHGAPESGGGLISLGGVEYMLSSFM